MYKYANEFTVTGNGELPFDMLRYDRAVPLTQIDASKATSSFNGSLSGPGVWEIRLVRFTEGNGRNHADNPTVDRWKSFGWTVSNVTWRRM